MSQGDCFQSFWDFLAHFEVDFFWFRDVSPNSRVLPRVVCLCGAVSVHGECHGVKRRVNDVFLRCVPRVVVDCGKPSVGRDLLGAEASGRQALHGKTLL